MNKKRPIKRCGGRLKKYVLGGSPDKPALQNQQQDGNFIKNNSSLFGMIAGAVTGLAEGTGKAIGGEAGAAIGNWNPLTALNNEDLSTSKRIIGAFLPALGGVWGHRAARKKAQLERKHQNALTSANTQFSQKMQENPQNINIPTFDDGGPITPLVTITPEQRAATDSLKNYQGTLTGALYKKAGGKYNVDSILTATGQDRNIRKNIDKYSQDVINKHGDYALTPDEIKDTLGDDYNKYIGLVKRYKTNLSDYSGIVNTKGNVEQAPDVTKENFGVRNMMEVYPWNKSEGTPYNYLKRKANGGLIQYNGQTHGGPDGGIPVDQNGNPSALSGNKPVALTENKEVAWREPNGGTYIFSEQLGFAKQAKSIMNRYKSRLGKEFDKDDKISLDTMNKELTSLMEKQEELKQEQGLENDSMGEYKKGGWIQKAVNPKHKGYCTPMTKSTCTPRRKALARTFKKHHGFHKKEDGGYLDDNDDMMYANGGNLEWYGILEAGGLIPDFPETRNYYMNTIGHNLSPTKTIDTTRTVKLAKGGGLPKYDGRSTATGYVPMAGDNFDARDLYYNPLLDPSYNEQLTSSGYNNNYTAEELGTGINLTPDNYTRSQNTEGKGVEDLQKTKLYQGNPWLQVGSAAASMLGNYVAQRADRRNRPRPVRLQRYMPQNVDYSESRRQTKEMAELDKANILRAMKGMGAGYMANATSALTNADRAKYNAIAASMENEGNINTQIANQAAMNNAEIANREALINLQNRDAYNARQRQYLQNYGQTAANTIGAIAQERAYYDALNLNPYYQITQDPSSRWYWRRPRFTARNS